MESYNYVFHIAICENDSVIQGKLSRYVTSFSTELGLTANIQQYTSMPLNPQAFFTRGNYMNLIIMSTDFDEKGIALCEELLNQNKTLPIILVTKEQSMLELGLPLIGVVDLPVIPDRFRLLFHRAVGQLLCNKKISNKRLNLVIDNKKISLAYESVISCKKMGEKVEMKCVQGSYLVVSTLKALREKFPDYFIQINQGTIINGKKILSFEQGTRTVTMRNKEEHNVTKAYRELVLQFLPKTQTG